MASINSLGGMPCASLCFTIIMYRIVTSPWWFQIPGRVPGRPQPAEAGRYLHVERVFKKSTGRNNFF
jgi:hypothetical protein